MFSFIIHNTVCDGTTTGLVRRSVDAYVSLSVSWGQQHSFEIPELLCYCDTWLHFPSGFCSCWTHVTHSIYLRWKICAIDHHCNSTHNVLSAAVTGPWTHDGKLTSKCWGICLMLFKIYDTVLLYQQHTNLYISTTGSRLMLCRSLFNHNHSFQLHYMMGKDRKRGEVMG